MIVNTFLGNDKMLCQGLLNVLDHICGRDNIALNMAHPLPRWIGTRQVLLDMTDPAVNAAVALLYTKMQQDIAATHTV